MVSPGGKGEPACTTEEERLEQDVRQNSSTTYKLDEGASLTPLLASAVVANFPSCWLGEFMTHTSSERRFLTCLGVHRSMALFAWMPGTDPIGFVAFLEAGAIKHSLERSKFLPEVVSAMSQAFGDRPRRKEVFVHFVGDLVGEPLKRFFPNDELFHRASVHMEAALRTVGFERFNRELLGIFEEAPENWRLPRFTAASLDSLTGCIVTQNYKPLTEAQTQIGPNLWAALEKEYRRERDVIFHRDGGGQPMTQSKDEWWSLWQLLNHVRTGGFCDWVAVFVLLACAFYLPYKLSVHENRNVIEFGRTPN
eukprot:TRINITY_DN108851_c0_g1_i1.p1 TRINITY_DN108851_c0_g1~~TRINITY_DN108851_c0_g1_i1.p1  ORF type:complete len:324 (+),score=53.49 TRINITY_DN108851_c0_g1_i1:46-972(+)